jgi:hypothetical protein
LIKTKVDLQVRDREMELVVMRGRMAGIRVHLGPRSVGHTACFALEHALCDVVLARWDNAGAPTA